MNPPPASPRIFAAFRAVALAAALCLTVAGCSAFGGSDADSDGGASGSPGGMKIALITHSAEGDAFWDLVRKGAEVAAAKDGVELTFVSDPDPAGQAKLVRDAIADKVDGIAVTLAKPQAMRGAVADARAAGIPVVGLNSGIDAWQSQGLLAFYGQDESVAGRALGNELDARAAKHALCVIHERGNVAVEARCAGVRKTFAGQTENLYVDGTDMDSVTDAVAARLRQDPTIDEVVTLGAQFALAAVDSVDDAGSKAQVATFDLNKAVVEAVREGDVQFAVDQQPYLQGYLAVDGLWLYRTNGNISGGGVEPVLTGPAFVTKKNIAGVAEFAANGTR
ncbi:MULTISPECIES: substrate-binding domain-containing protein [Streptomyces]|uniref:Substrate-binding domain-containing protein n=1 Tax=Streptomyces caniscabiei TaxID=2746961 RepID=A0ABU4MLN8_9ACTN|nr:MULTISPECIES: substrate-binding domain-containing protein [Streptomyces]MBE4739156.1 substrate-binding domain-containing protein [Streptomyces caniscabiei]MBE4758539.1 substrate-binding domain-containing protein [Streptomyces caniscabiei]MBE4771911.1 substrate-binding domain-containing protein [Streptomyces caniscabiei]MBE4787972.1 substrate-binding domain-containing protein [Streptomyces caniscabiei]MBE4797194.1 substrate-binding domain-containing protein [Streptomyces caniscabiei]